MHDSDTPIQKPQIDARRGAHLTALIAGGIAIAIYVGFLVLNSVAK